MIEESTGMSNTQIYSYELMKGNVITGETTIGNNLFHDLNQALISCELRWSKLIKMLM